MTPPRKQGETVRKGLGAAATPTGMDGGDGFDRWVRRQLHQLYDPVSNEPLPDRLADLLDRFPEGTSTDRRRHERGGDDGDG